MDTSLASRTEGEEAHADRISTAIAAVANLLIVLAFTRRSPRLLLRAHSTRAENGKPVGIGMFAKGGMRTENEAWSVGGGDVENWPPLAEIQYDGRPLVAESGRPNSRTGLHLNVRFRVTPMFRTLGKNPRRAGTVPIGELAAGGLTHLVMVAHVRATMAGGGACIF